MNNKLKEMKYIHEVNEVSVMSRCSLVISFSLLRWGLVKTGGCQKDVVSAITSKNNLHLKYLICFIWQGMLLPSGSLLNKIGACEW